MYRFYYVHFYSASTDYYVFNRAMIAFVKKAPAARLFNIPDSYHELLLEKETIRNSCKKVIIDFFNQKSDNVNLVQPCYPMEVYDVSNSGGIYSYPELILRGTGLVIATVGFIIGVAMILGDKRRN